MPQAGMIYRVLVASPSDCSHERQLIPSTLYAWNAAHSLATAAILEPVLWETHARPELGDRPQALINKQLVDNCDILIGTFWTRLGTSTGKAESGTAEEIEEFRAKGKHVLLYFSLAPVVPDSLDNEQYQALKAYKKKLAQHGLYFEYDTPDTLGKLLHRHLAGTMAELHTGTANLEKPDEKSPPDDDLRKYQSSVAAFLRRFEAEWASERDSGPGTIDEGKLILAAALDGLLHHRAQIVHGHEDVTSIFEDASKRLRALQRHQIYLDGGRSLRAFWTEGDAVIAQLKAVLPIIEKHANKSAGA